MLNARLQKYNSKEMLRNLQLCFESDVNGIAAERIFLHRVPADAAVDVAELAQKQKEAQTMSYVFEYSDISSEFISTDMKYRTDEYDKACRYIFDTNIALLYKDSAQMQSTREFTAYLYDVFRALGDVIAKNEFTHNPPFKKATWYRFNVGVKQLLNAVLCKTVRKGECVTNILFPPYCDCDADSAFENRGMLSKIIEEKEGELYLTQDDVYSAAYICAAVESFNFKEHENRLETLSRLNAFLKTENIH